MTGDILQMRDYDRKPRPAPDAPGCHVVPFKSREVLALEGVAEKFEIAARELDAMLNVAVAACTAIAVRQGFLAVHNLATMARSLAQMTADARPTVVEPPCDVEPQS